MSTTFTVDGRYYTFFPATMNGVDVIGVRWVYHGESFCEWSAEAMMPQTQDEAEIALTHYPWAIVEAIDDFEEGDRMKGAPITVSTLATWLEMFRDWVGTPSEELLEDGGTVIDHLLTEYADPASPRYSPIVSRQRLEAVFPETWQQAWDLFDARG